MAGRRSTRQIICYRLDARGNEVLDLLFNPATGKLGLLKMPAAVRDDH
jgi:hypothetical protein